VTKSQLPAVSFTFNLSVFSSFVPFKTVGFLFQIIENAILKRSSSARIIDVYRNCGYAISTTIAATIQTSRLTSAVNVTALTAGSVVPAGPIIDAYQNGCSATVKTIVAMARTSCPRIARNVTRPATSSVKVIDVFPSEFTKASLYR
jgi:hypothetical protein